MLLLASECCLYLWNVVFIVFILQLPHVETAVVKPVRYCLRYVGGMQRGCQLSCGTVVPLV